MSPVKKGKTKHDYRITGDMAKLDFKTYSQEQKIWEKLRKLRKSCHYNRNRIYNESLQYNYPTIAHFKT